MDEAKATALFEKWRKILQLEAWDIVLQPKVHGQDMNLPECLGCTTFRHESRQAIVQMLDPYEFRNDFFEYNYEKTLVHEMLHIKFADLDNSGDTLRDKLTHQLIDDLARSFYDAAHQESEAET